MMPRSTPGSPDPDLSSEFDDERPDAPAAHSTARTRSRSFPLRLAIAAALVAALVGGALAWRAHHRRGVVAQALSRAELLLRSDTAEGYRSADALLEPLSALDPVQPAALRGFALAMLALDYRDEEAARRAEALLVEPGRAADAPRWVHLAYGALALARGEAGTAMSYAARASDGAWPAVLQARVALLAGQPEAARETLDRAVAGDPGAAALQALRGDALRRSGHAAEAREAYAAALTASPLHPRAAFGLAKLALAGANVAPEAREALRRLAEDDATPSNERARAALHLAALEARAGRRTEAAAAIARAPVDADAREWLERAVHDAARTGGLHVAGSAPPALRSASDDEPPTTAPRPPPSSSISPTFRIPEPEPRPAPPAAPAAKKPVAKAAPPVAAKPPPARKPTASKPPAKKPAAAAKPTARKPTAQTKPAPAKPAVAKSPAPPAAKPAAARPSDPAPSDGLSALERAMSKVR
jgi:tetratricopeptide (TPR) repeat protein